MTLKIDDLKDDLVALRHDIHRHPELAFEETRTSDIVAAKLASYGIEVHRGLARTGVVGVLKSGISTRAIGIRADMDALPIQEANRFPHRSEIDGRMHACGHDGHTAMLLGAARYLAATRAFDGIVYFIFQPAEENEGGAKVMIEEGLFEKFPMDQVFGMHNMPGIAAGTFAMCAGPIMAAIDMFEIILTGKGTHAAMPHLGIDTLMVAAHVISALQTIVARNIDPLKSAVVSATQCHGGDTWNVIPEEVVIRGCVRSFLPEVRAILKRRMEEISEGIAQAYGAKARFNYIEGYPATVNNAGGIAAAAAAAADVVGAEKVNTNMTPMMASEDFAFMLEKKPGSYIMIGNGAGTGSCMVHNPSYDFNDDILTTGVRYWTRLVERQLAKA
jgi:hippurate hydrolase